MARSKSRLNTYILGIAVVVAVVAGYYLPTKRPESGAMLTPKEYIELVEQKKQQRLRYEKEQKQRAEEEQDAKKQVPDSTGQDRP